MLLHCRLNKYCTTLYTFWDHIKLEVMSHCFYLPTNTCKNKHLCVFALVRGEHKHFFQSDINTHIISIFNDRNCYVGLNFHIVIMG